MTTLASASFTRSRIESGEKPPKITEWMAPDAGAGQQRHRQLGDHGQVDDHPVALLDAKAAQHVGQAGDVLEQLGRR
jgi:hypothetical protein